MYSEWTAEQVGWRSEEGLKWREEGTRCTEAWVVVMGECDERWKEPVWATYVSLAA